MQEVLKQEVLKQRICSHPKKLFPLHYYLSDKKQNIAVEAFRRQRETMIYVRASGSPQNLEFLLCRKIYLSLVMILPCSVGSMLFLNCIIFFSVSYKHVLTFVGSNYSLECICLRRNCFKHSIAWTCFQFALQTSVPSKCNSKFVSTMQFSGRWLSFSTLADSSRYRVSGLAIKLAATSQRFGFNKTLLNLTTTMKALKGINNIASIVENARRRSLAKEEKENIKRDSFCKGDNSRRESLVKSGSRRESLILGFESEEILQGKRRKSLKFAAGRTF